MLKVTLANGFSFIVDFDDSKKSEWESYYGRRLVKIRKVKLNELLQFRYENTAQDFYGKSFDKLSCKEKLNITEYIWETR